ncbi:MAG: neutral/alkaline non-lysosomal ceramidase N-terminal domain-containing protein [Phycisphaerae bacterium]
MLLAGFARVDITPPRECTLQGYEFRFSQLSPGNDGVLDPLHARALAIDTTHDDAGPAILLSLDICIVSVELACRLSNRIAQRVGTSPGRVLVTTTHTHSGPDLDEPELADMLGAVFEDTDADAPDSPGRRYTAFLEDLAVEAAVRAAGLMTPVRARTIQAPLGLAYNRRVPTADGQVAHCWNPREQTHLRPAPADDPTCTVLALEQPSGGRRILLFNAAAHPTVLGKTSRVVSADWPGAACRAIEQAVPGSDAMFLPGASGDLHPWIATQDDPAGVQRVGVAAGSFVALLSHALRDGDETLTIARRDISVAGQDVPLAGWRIGGMLLLASPTEMFSALSAELRTRVDRPLMCVTCAGGWTGYWPTKQAFAEGSYEVDAARAHGRSADDSATLVDALVKLAGELTD